MSFGYNFDGFILRHTKSFIQVPLYIVEQFFKDLFQTPELKYKKRTINMNILRLQELENLYLHSQQNIKINPIDVDLPHTSKVRFANIIQG